MSLYLFQKSRVHWLDCFLACSDRSTRKQWVDETPAAGLPMSLTLPEDVQRLVDEINKHRSKLRVARVSPPFLSSPLVLIVRSAPK